MFWRLQIIRDAALFFYLPTSLLYTEKNSEPKKFGKNNRINTVSIHPSANLGEGVYLAENVDIRSDVEIGDFSYCSPGRILFSGTKIGKYCSIGYNVQISCPEHPVHFISTSPVIYRNERISTYCSWPHNDISSPVTVGNDVWIGSNVVILQGTNIGDGAIIAAGAVVTKDVPSFSIVGGACKNKWKAF